MCRVVELTNQLNETLKQLNVEFDKINGDMINVDNEILDVYHYIEFADLDVVRGYKAYKELQGLLRKRRDLKDSQQIMNELKDSNLVNISTKIDDKMREMDKRSFCPRARQDLFDREITYNNKKLKIKIDDSNDPDRENKTKLVGLDIVTNYPRNYKDVDNAVADIVHTGSTRGLTGKQIRQGILDALESDNHIFFDREWKVMKSSDWKILIDKYNRGEEYNSDDIVASETETINNNPELPLNMISDATILRSPMEMTHSRTGKATRFKNVKEACVFFSVSNSTGKNTFKKKVLKAIRQGCLYQNHTWKTLAGKI